MKQVALIILMLFAMSMAASTPSGGLGLTKQQWESMYKKTGLGNFGVTYGKYEVLFVKNQVQEIGLVSDSAIPEAEAVKLIKTLMPADAKFIAQIKTSRPTNKAFLYSSTLLGAKFHYQYNKYPSLQGVTRVLIAIGDKPVVALKLTYPKAKTEYYFAKCEYLNKRFPYGVGNWHPAYRPTLDRNNNGWACEPTPR